VVWRIIVPVTWPGLVATATYGFLQCWSEYLLALTLLTDESVKTIPLGLYQFFGDDRINWGMVMAGSVAAIVPTLALFLPLQRLLVSGLTAGAVK
jgi:ABC-type glycerol-3-phosphate transport system permease component